MTLKDICELCQKNNIPDDVTLYSDSGWECCETDVDEVWYAEQHNCLVLTQAGAFPYTPATLSDHFKPGDKFVKLE